MALRIPEFSRFARFQSVSDLHAIALDTPMPVFEAVAARVPGMPPPTLLKDAIRSDARLTTEAAAFLPALLLAANLPAEDEAGFVMATAILLADRLRHGAGEDDLYWHFDAHRDTYATLCPDVRSAFLMGYALLHDMNRVALDAPPGANERRARPGGLVRAALTSVPETTARILRSALDGGPLDEAETLWRTQAEGSRDEPAVTGALRHLYATRPEWDPYRGIPDDVFTSIGVALPFPCALPQPHGTV